MIHAGVCGKEVMIVGKEELAAVIARALEKSAETLIMGLREGA
jgi:hypothetical protein